MQIPHHISRTFIKLHTELTFVYGYDVIGKGMMGQPWAAHGEPNAFPIPTMYKFCPSGHVLFTDGRINEWRDIWCGICIIYFRVFHLVLSNFVVYEHDTVLCICVQLSMH